MEAMLWMPEIISSEAKAASFQKQSNAGSNDSFVLRVPNLVSYRNTRLIKMPRSPKLRFDSLWPKITIGQPESIKQTSNLISVNISGRPADQFEAYCCPYP